MSITRERLHHILRNDSPNDQAALTYNQVMTVIIVISLLPLCFKETSAGLLLVEAVCTVVFIVDYAMRWATADYKLGKGAWSFVLYPFTPMALADLASILPIFIELNPSLRAIRILRLLRAVRAYKLVRNSQAFNTIIEAVKLQRDHLVTVGALAVVYVLGCAIIIFNVEPETFDTFFDAVYWAIVSLTTVGYGDLYPLTNVGRAVAMLSSFVGVAIIALPSSIITAGFMELLDERDNHDERPVQSDAPACFSGSGGATRAPLGCLDDDPAEVPAPPTMEV